MKQAWVFAGLGLLAGAYALHAQVVPSPGPPSGIACAFNTVPPTLTSGQAGWVQCDNAGKIITSGGGGGGSVTQGTSPWVDNITQWASVALGAPSAYGTSPGAVNVPGVNAFITNAASFTAGYTLSTLTGWTTATAANAVQTLMPISGNYGAAILVQLDQTTTLTVGAVTFEGTFDGTNWVTIPVAQVLNANTFAPLTNPYTLVASTNQPFLILPQGYQGVRVRLSTQITGSATVTPFVALLPFDPTGGAALLNPIPAGTASIGTVQPGNTPNTTPWLANPTSQYPSGATPITASATGTTGATTATLAGTSGKTTYICGYSIRANATANTNVTNTITGVITATLSSIMWVPANTAGLGVDEQIFSPCIPASATNTGIAIVSGAPGTGGLVSSKGWGYQL